MWGLWILEGVANVMEVVTFIQFIMEEAVQTASLGTFIALRAGVSTAVTKGINRMNVCVTHLEGCNDSLGWIAPYSKWPFEDFVDATRTNIEIYTDLLYARIAKEK